MIAPLTASGWSRRGVWVSPTRASPLARSVRYSEPREWGYAEVTTTPRAPSRDFALLAIPVSRIWRRPCWSHSTPTRWPTSSSGRPGINLEDHDVGVRRCKEEPTIRNQAAGDENGARHYVLLTLGIGKAVEARTGDGWIPAYYVRREKSSYQGVERVRGIEPP